MYTLFSLIVFIFVSTYVPLSSASLTATTAAVNWTHDSLAISLSMGLLLLAYVEQLHIDRSVHLFKYI